MHLLGLSNNSGDWYIYIRENISVACFLNSLKILKCASLGGKKGRDGVMIK